MIIIFHLDFKFIAAPLVCMHTNMVVISIAWSYFAASSCLHGYMYQIVDIIAVLLHSCFAVSYYAKQTPV